MRSRYHEKDVVSVNVDATIEEAALIMYKNKIGGMPVVSNMGAVVGVITETDIFKTFVDVMGLADGKTRITLEVTDKIGVVKDIAEIFGQAGVSIDSLITCKKKIINTKSLFVVILLILMISKQN